MSARDPHLTFKRLRYVPRLAVVAAMCVTAVAACDRSRDTKAGKVSAGSKARERTLRPAADSASPIEVIRRVHGYRLAGQLGLLEDHIVPEQRGRVVELIQAVDRLLWGDGVLQAAVTDHFGPATARAFDRSRAANVVGVFSRDVEVLDERIDGESAEVTIQIADRIPLDVVHLVRREGRWMIRTDPPIPGVAAEIRRLADVLVDTARMLDDREMTPVELKKELALREMSVGRRITALTGPP